MDFNINKSPVKSHVCALFVGENLKTTPKTKDEMQQYLPLYFWIQACRQII